MPFRGWPAEALEFFEGLEADNSRAYWQDHKDVYERDVRGPMELLLAELAPEFGEPKLFRPYRDVRFSADKSPYKTSIAASLAGGGYVQLTSHGLGVGGGMYHMAPDQLERFRRAVADDGSGEALGAITADLRRAGIDVSAHETLKTVPRGYPKDHPRADLLRQKGLIFWKQWPAAAWLGTKAAKTRVVNVLKAGQPLLAWLEANVGESRVPQQR